MEKNCVGTKKLRLQDGAVQHTEMTGCDARLCHDEDVIP